MKTYAYDGITNSFQFRGNKQNQYCGSSAQYVSWLDNPAAPIQLIMNQVKNP